jgi:hypothetical protein
VEKIIYKHNLPQLNFEVWDMSKAKDLIARLKKELESQWLQNHDERCTNMEDCASFGHPEKPCQEPRPAILDEDFKQAMSDRAEIYREIMGIIELTIENGKILKNNELKDRDEYMAGWNDAFTIILENLKSHAGL